MRASIVAGLGGVLLAAGLAMAGFQVCARPAGMPREVEEQLSTQRAPRQQRGGSIPAEFEAAVRADLQERLRRQVVACAGAAALILLGGLLLVRVRRAGSPEATNRDELLLHSIVENLPNMVFVKDAATLRFVLFNRAGEQLLGYPREQMIGRSDYDFFSKEQADFFTGKDRAVLESRRLLDIPEESIQTRNHELRYLHTKKIPLLDAAGKPLYLLGISEDITALKQAELERTVFFLRAVDPMCILNFEGRFLQVNPAFTRTLHYGLAEIEQQPFVNFLHPDDVAFTERAFARLLAGEEAGTLENRCLARDGELHVFSWTATADPALRRIYAVARDVTERKRLEAEVVEISGKEQERIAHDLHDGLGQVMTGLAYKAKLIEGMLRDGERPDAQQAAEIVALANQASAQARALARGLDPVMLDEGLAPALTDLAHATEEMLGVRCTFTTDGVAAVDDKGRARHLYRIAQEAVHNAFKHGRASQITLSLRRRGGEVILAVEDNGCGLAAGPGLPKGRGLRLMDNRARMIFGALCIARNAQGGVTVSCAVRCDETAA